MGGPARGRALSIAAAFGALAAGGAALGFFFFAPALSRSRTAEREARLRDDYQRGPAAAPGEMKFLLDTLGDPGDVPLAHRTLAGAALARLDPRGDRCLASLIERLAAPQTEIRQAGVAALGQLGAGGMPADRARPALVARLADAAGIVRAGAATALGMFGASMREAAPELRQALRDPDFEVRQSAIWSLGRIAPDDASLVPSLVEALADAEPKVRARAAVALGERGAQAALALPALEKLAADPDPLVQRHAQEAAAKVAGRK